ncbi:MULTISPECIES: homing endonuclease associated repeat-containing protein [Bacillus amyloliquefaciens group]|uniref:homing endonuclease associated repeat-containing protein n=1 Tax=Bacillus amyloliquefaciens TaxID=1390 RepID=UPI002ED89D68
MLRHDLASKKLIILRLQEIYEKTGKSPKKQDVEDIKRIESIFGSWTEALIEAGFFRRRRITEQQRLNIKGMVEEINILYKARLKKNIAPPPELETMVLALAAVKIMREEANALFTREKLNALLIDYVGSAPVQVTHIYPIMNEIDNRIFRPRKGCYVFYPAVQGGNGSV